MNNSASKGELRRSGWHVRSRQENVGARDKMQPSLLDRLTDNEPEKKYEVAGSNLITHTALRRNMLRDLQWLFNTINHDASCDLSALPHVSRSVVNFGIASLAGKRMSDIEWHDIQSKLTEAIIHFEPRILPQELLVRCVSDTSSLDLHNILSIEIKGRLWCVPYTLEFLFLTDVDLENGHFELKDGG